MSFKPKKETIIILIIIAIIVLGFIIGAVLPETEGGSCTLMACPCDGVSGERLCNSCSFPNHIFTTGILNVVQQCPAQEIITCENNQETGKRYDIGEDGCEYDWNFFGIS